MVAQAQVIMVPELAGENNNIVPRIVRLYCPNNTLAEVTAAGFLDDYLRSQNTAIVSTDFVATVASDGHQFYKPVFTNGSCQLTLLP